MEQLKRAWSALGEYGGQTVPAAHFFLLIFKLQIFIYAQDIPFD